MVAEIRADEMLARLSPQDRRAVEWFRDDVRTEYGERIRDMRLYGSKARGDDHEESDIDILVLLDVKDAETALLITYMAHFIDPRITPMIFAFDRYHAPEHRVTGFYEELRKESVRL